MAYVSNEGFQIAFDVYGRGAGTGFLFAQRKVGWDRMGYVQRLSGLGKVLVVDPRGYGDSTRARDQRSYGLEACCDDLLCAADAVGLETFVAWGYSNSAALAVALAARTERAVAVACCGIDPYQDFTVWGRHLDREVAEAGEGNYVPEGHFDWRAARAFYAGYSEWQQDLGGQFRCPGAVVYGGGDAAIVPSIESHRTEIERLGFELRALPGLDHQQCLEAADTVVDAVLASISW